MSIDDTQDTGAAAPPQDAEPAAAPDGAASTAATYYTTPSKITNVYSGPGTGYALVDTLPKHSAVSISCQTPGQSVTGPYGTSKIWDCIGRSRYVSDAYVYTGSDGYVTGRC